MKILDYDYLSINSLDTIPGIKETEYKPGKSKTVTEVLSDLFSLEKGRFDNRFSHKLVVRCFGYVPFGPDPALLIDHLYKDADSLRDALIAIKKFFDLEELMVVGPQVYTESLQCDELSRNKRITSRSYDYPVINLFEAYIVYRAIKDNIHLQSRLVSIFINPNTSFSFLAPIGLALEELITQNSELSDVFKEHDGAGFIHPLTGQEFDLSTDCVECGKDLLSASFSTFTLSSDKRLVFDFPYFSQSIRMKEDISGNKKSSPCNNCLSCYQYCPSDLYPNFIYHYLIKDNVDDALSINMHNCIQCGICSFVCPCALPIANKIGKALVD